MGTVATGPSEAKVSMVAKLYGLDHGEYDGLDYRVHDGLDHGVYHGQHVRQYHGVVQLLHHGLYNGHQLVFDDRIDLGVQEQHHGLQQPLYDAQQ